MRLGCAGWGRGRGAPGRPRAASGPGVDAAEITSWKIPLLEVPGRERGGSGRCPGPRGRGSPAASARSPARNPRRPRAPRPAPPAWGAPAGAGPGSPPPPPEPAPQPGAPMAPGGRPRGAGRGGAAGGGGAPGLAAAPSPCSRLPARPPPRCARPAARTMSRRRLPVTPWGAGEGGRRGRRAGAGDRRRRRAGAASGRVRAARSPGLLGPSVRPSVRQAGARPRARSNPAAPAARARAPRPRTLTPPPGARPAAADWPAPRPGRGHRPGPRPRRPGRRPRPSLGPGRRAAGSQGAAPGVRSPPRGRPDSGSAGWSSLGIVGSPLPWAGGGLGRRGAGVPLVRAAPLPRGRGAAWKPPHGSGDPGVGTQSLPRPRTGPCPHAGSSGARGCPGHGPSPRPTHRCAARVSQTWRLPQPSRASPRAACSAEKAPPRKAARGAGSGRSWAPRAPNLGGLGAPGDQRTSGTGLVGVPASGARFWLTRDTGGSAWVPPVVSSASRGRRAPGGEGNQRPGPRPSPVCSPDPSGPGRVSTTGRPNPVRRFSPPRPQPSGGWSGKRGPAFLAGLRGGKGHLASSPRARRREGR